MFRYDAILLLIACLGFLPLSRAHGESPAGATATVRADGDGDPLPLGAIARMGTLRWRPGGAIGALALSPDGHLLAVGTQQRVELWDAVNGDEVRLFPSGENANFRLLAFSPDGKMLAAVATVGQVGNPNGDLNAIHIWETASGKERLRLKPLFAPSVRDPRFGVVNNNALTALTFSADSRLLVAGGSDSTIRLWDLLTGDELPPLTGFRGAPGVLRCPPDGKELIAVDDEGTRLIWKQARIRRSAHGRLLPLSEADFAELWDDLTESDAFRGDRARRYLAADPTRTLPLLQRHLRPIPPGDATRIKKLLGDLQNPNGGTRRQAMMELRTKQGEAALGALAHLPPETANTQAVQVLLLKLQAHYNTPESARTLKAVGVLEEIGTPEARQLLEKLSKGAAGVSLTTEAKAALDRLTARAKVRLEEPKIEYLWKDLASDDAILAFQAVRGLALRPQEAVPLLRKQMKPVLVFEDKHIERRIADLEADDFKTREQATQELEKVGEQGLAALKKTLAGRPSLEARKRIERLVEQLTVPIPPLVLRSLRALEALEHIATADAQQVLQTLSGGALRALLTREAKASVQRLSLRR